MARNREKKSSRFERPSVAGIIEDILGCKWTLSILLEVRRGTLRPGAIQRAIPGLSTKVMNERLAKLVRFGVLARNAFPEVPPRVEYTLTPFGRRLVPILDAIEALEEDTEAEAAGSATASKRSG